MKTTELPENFNDCVAMEISKRREEKGLTQTVLAKAIGSSQSALSKLEKGLTPITVTHVVEIARVLGCTPSDLVKQAERNWKRRGM